MDAAPLPDASATRFVTVKALRRVETPVESLQAATANAVTTAINPRVATREEWNRMTAPVNAMPEQSTRMEPLDDSRVEPGEEPATIATTATGDGSDW